ncbi:MAG: acyl-CoA dehydrogenase [Mycobacterium sp.]|nr:acyl-CoA dehydrogenase [Mycobacterium sp.]
MGIAVTEEHRELEKIARSFLGAQKARLLSRELLDAPSESLPTFWSELAELGWLGMHIPEQYGGSGFGLPELVVVTEELGRAVAPGPFLPTVITSTVIATLGSAEQRARLLPGLAGGTAVAAVAFSSEITLRKGVAHGDAGVALGAGVADLLLIAAGCDVLVVEATRPGVVIDVPTNLDPTRRSGHVTFNNVSISSEHVISGAASRALAIGRLLAAAEAVGGAQDCLDAAVGYAKVREQFGRTIGTFQAVKHHAANMLVHAELATAAAWDAARADTLDDARFGAAVAAAHAIHGQIFNAENNIQLHGGIGFTWEHDAHLYLRRARTLAALTAAGADPLADVVDAQRAGWAHGASFALPAEAAEHRTAARAAVATLSALPADKQRDFLVDSGYLVPHWPKPWGRDAGVLEQLAIEEEFRDVERPDLGITGWVTLTIAQAGTDDQRERWVEPVLRGEIMWCQLFSEPDAGSDAAAVRTSAKKVDGGWLVTGQKVWTSLAQYCQWGLATVRTDADAPKHAGVTMMAIDMKSSGVTVNPLRGLTGTAHFNEVFFDEVFVPDADVVGDVNKGWLVARATLGNERLSIGGGSGAQTGFTADDLISLLDAAPPHQAAGLLGRAGSVLAEGHTLRLLNLRRISRAIAGTGPGPEGNVTKLVVAEQGQRLTELAMELAGPAAVTGQAPALTQSYLGYRAMTIAGGTSEITRNTIAERILGLPRDPLLK